MKPSKYPYLIRSTMPHQILAIMQKRIDGVRRTFLQLPYGEQIGIAIILCMAVAAPFVPSSGWDFLIAFRNATLTGEYGVLTWNPYPTYWLFYPFVILPARLGFLFWNLLTAVGFIYAIHRGHGQFLRFAVSLPAFWIFFIGQLEGFVAFGLILGLYASPIIAGLGLAFLTLKPQIGLFPFVFILFHRRDWRLLTIPGLIYFLSLFQWGWWLPEWLLSLRNSSPVNNLTNISLFPYALLLLPLLLWAHLSLKIWLIVQSLVAPYFAVYSLAPLFCIMLPLWANLLLWGLYGAAIWIHYPVPGFLVALGLLLAAMYEEWSIRKSKHNISRTVN